MNEFRKFSFTFNLHQYLLIIAYTSEADFWWFGILSNALEGYLQSIELSDGIKKKKRKKNLII